MGSREEEGGKSREEEGRRSRWWGSTVISEGRGAPSTSKFQAALQDLEALRGWGSKEEEEEKEGKREDGVGRREEEGGRFEGVPQPLLEERSGKAKRASGDYLDRKKTTCMLYLQADHLFYEKMGRSQLTTHSTQSPTFFPPPSFSSNISYTCHLLSPGTCNLSHLAPATFHLAPLPPDTCHLPPVTFPTCHLPPGLRRLA